MVRKLFAGVGILWLVAVIAYAVGAPMLADPTGSAATAIADATGITEQVAKVGEERCRLAQANYDELWDRSVENGDSPAMDTALARAEASVKTYCSEE